MAKRMVKCFYCGEMFDANSEAFEKPRANRYAHKSCADKANEGKTQIEKDREALENYIKQLFGINSISIKIKRQIETFSKENNFTYTGMHKTLKYFFEIRGNDIAKANGGIGIVPWVYDEASRYWRALWEAQQQNEDIQIQEFVLPTREVHIVPPQRQPMKRFKARFTFLDEESEE